MHISDTSTRTRTAFALHAVCGALLILSSLPATAASTLDKVAKSGVVSLGYRDNSLPFSYLNADKRPIGYSIDICLKVVDAIKRELKRPDLAVKFVPVTSVTRYPMLIDGQIDLECANTPSTADTSTTMTPTVAPIPPS
mgnify:CR=1 FL=1